MGKSKKAGKGSKKTYKSEIVKEYIVKFPSASTNALARIVARDYPLDFNLESARSLVRTYRDGLGGKNEPLRTEEERKNAMGKFAIPATDYIEMEHLVLPKEHNKILLLSDVHVPYHDIEAIQLALDYGLEQGMNAIYLNGDFMDCYMISRFTTDRRLRDMAGELEQTRQFLEFLQDEYGLPIYYKIGNHEDRWENYLRNKAPELLGISDFELKNVLKFKKFGVIEVKSKQIGRAGKLNIMHGHEFFQGSFAAVSPARSLYTKTKENTIIGHHHQTSEHSEKSLNGDVVTCWSTGALCGMKPDYMPYNKWNLGFAFVNVNPDNGHFRVDNKRIIDGEVR